MNIDYEKLRSDLFDYFGTASMYNFFAVIELEKVRLAKNEKLIEIALKYGFDLDNYKVKVR